MNKEQWTLGAVCGLNFEEVWHSTTFCLKSVSVANAWRDSNASRVWIDLHQNEWRHGTKEVFVQAATETTSDTKILITINNNNNDDNNNNNNNKNKFKRRRRDALAGGNASNHNMDGWMIERMNDRMIEWMDDIMNERWMENMEKSRRFAEQGMIPWCSGATFDCTPTTGRLTCLVFQSRSLGQNCST